MRSISIKALLLSNLANVLFAVVGIVVTILLALIVEISVLGPGHIDDAFKGLESSSDFGVVLCVPVVIANIFAGFIAGRMAASQRVLNGALSSAIIILFGIYLSIFGWDSHTDYHQQLPSSVDLAVSWGGPIFGALGGFAAEKIEPRLVLSWTLAFPAAAGVYLVVFYIAVKTHSHFLLAMASAVAICVGAGVAPKEHRKQAFVTMSVVLILIPLAVLIWRLSAGGGSTGNYMWIFYNGMGALFAFMWVRKYVKPPPGGTISR